MLKELRLEHIVHTVTSKKLNSFRFENWHRQPSFYIKLPEMARKFTPEEFVESKDSLVKHSSIYVQQPILRGHDGTEVACFNLVYKEKYNITINATICKSNSKLYKTLEKNVPKVDFWSDVAVTATDTLAAELIKLRKKILQENVEALFSHMEQIRIHAEYQGERNLRRKFREMMMLE